MSGRGRGAGKAQVEHVDAGTERGMAERDRAIDVAMSQIERQFGKGSIMKLGETSRLAIEVIPTGAIVFMRPVERFIQL